MNAEARQQSQFVFSAAVCVVEPRFYIATMRLMQPPLSWASSSSQTSLSGVDGSQTGGVAWPMKSKSNAERSSESNFSGKFDDPLLCLAWKRVVPCLFPPLRCVSIFFLHAEPSPGRSCNIANEIWMIKSFQQKWILPGWELCLRDVTER